MEIVYEQCAYKGCGHSPFPMAKKFQDRCRRTHESFFCPGGHSLSYHGESEEEKLRKEVKILERQLEDACWKRDSLLRQLHRCPWIGCSFVARPVNDYDMRAMWSHLRQAHGMPTRVEHEAAIDKEQSNVR